MNYEKAYNDALKRAKAMIEVASNQEEAEGYVSTIFPELKESEGERIREELISIVENWKSYNPKSPFADYPIFVDNVEKCDEILAWLEKQKNLTDEEYEQGKKDVLWCINQAKKNAKDENEMGTCWFAEKWLEKQGEKKSSDEVLKIRQEVYQSGYNDGYKHGIEDVKQGEQKPVKCTDEPQQESSNDNKSDVFVGTFKRQQDIFKQQQDIFKQGKEDLKNIESFCFSLEDKIGWQKEYLLKDAVEREVKEDAGGYPYIDKTELYDYDNDKPLAKAGDKIKVLIVKDK